MFAAAGKTGDCAARAADSRKLLTTIRAAIDEPRGVSSHRKRQIVTPLLVGDSQVDASLLAIQRHEVESSVGQRETGREYARVRGAKSDRFRLDIQIAADLTK